MYKNWGFMSANSLSFSDAPIGQTSSLRTCDVPLTALNDTNNYYSGSHNLAPGAKYDIESWTGLGQSLARRRGKGEVYTGTMGTSARACLLPSASYTLPDRPSVSPRPGPGSYVRNDSSVFGRNSTFDGAFRQNPAKADLDEKVTRLRTIETDLSRIRERVANMDKMKPEEAKLFKVSSKLESTNLKKQRAAMLSEIATQRAAMKKIVDHPGPNGKAKKLLFDKTFAKSVPMNNKCERFYDPVVSTATYHEAPGPGNYDVAERHAVFGNSKTGVALRNKGVSWGNEFRPTDINAPDSKSVAVVKLNKNGYAYYSDLNPNAGNNYQPLSVPERKKVARKNVNRVNGNRPGTGGSVGALRIRRVNREGSKKDKVNKAAAT